MCGTLHVIFGSKAIGKRAKQLKLIWKVNFRLFANGSVLCSALCFKDTIDLWSHLCLIGEFYGAFMK